MNTVKDRLTAFLAHLGVGQTAFEKECGLSRGYINKVQDSIGSKILAKVRLVHPELNPEWLTSGDGSMLLTEAQKSRERHKQSRGVPYYAVSFMGGFDTVENDQSTMPDSYVSFPKFQNAEVWCDVEGHSMEPLISDGDIIALREIHSWSDFLLAGEVYAIVTEELRTVKIVTKSDLGEGYIRLVPANKSPEYQPQDLPKKLVRRVYKVLGCMKKI